MCLIAKICGRRFFCSPAFSITLVTLTPDPKGGGWALGQVLGILPKAVSEAKVRIPEGATVGAREGANGRAAPDRANVTYAKHPEGATAGSEGRG